MNAYEKAVELGLDVEGDVQDILSVLALVTSTDLPSEAIRQYLAEGDGTTPYWAESPGGMIGAIHDAYVAETTPAFKRRFEKVWRWLYSSHSVEVVRTTQQEESFTFNWLLNQSGATPARKNDFYRLATPTVDKPFQDTTVEDFNTQKAAAAEQVNRQAIIDACLAPIQAAQAAAAARLNNANASLGPEHVDGLTLQELQARCDAVTASADGVV